jgi:hypothetical protein
MRSNRTTTAQIILEDKDPRKEDALKTMKRAMGKYTVQQLMVNMKSKQKPFELLARY